MSAEHGRPSWLTEELLSRLLRDGVWAVDGEGVTVHVNERMAELLGVPPEEILGRPLFQFMEGEWRRRAERYLERARQGEDDRFEFCFRRPDGEPVWARVATVGAFEGGRFVGAVATIADIRPEKDTEARLREAEVRLREAAAHMPGVVYQLRYAADGDLTIEYISESVVQFGGLSAEELMRDGASAFRLVHREDVPLVAEQAARAARDLAPVAFGFRMIGHSGEPRHMYTTASVARRDDGHVVAYGVALDVTESRRAEEERRESQARLDAVFDNLPFDCWALDVDRTFVLQNGASLATWGDHRGQRLEDVDVPDDLARDWSSDVARALRGDTVRREASYVLRGTPQHIDRIVAPIRAGDEILGAFCVQIDLTSQRRLEEQLLRSQKLDAVGRMAGGIAHDFNNVLTAILSCVRLLERRFGSAGQRELALIREGGERAAALTRQLLAFARQELVAPSVLVLDHVVLSTDALLRRVIGEDVELVTRVDAAEARVRIDPVRFEQAIVNLAVNARDAMPSGGTLTIRTEDRQLDAPRAGVDSLIPAGRYAVLRVSDTGGGMSPETRERAFEPFFTTRAEAGGTGLGLSTVHGSIRQAGGHLELESEVGVGTTLSIYLPVVEAEETPAPPRARSEPSRGGETILLVEDEPLVMHVLAEALQQSGYRVLESKGFADALRVAQGYPGDIHLVVTDVVMPYGSGPELADRLAIERPDTAVLFISGYARDRLGAHGDRRDVAFLPKPFTPDRLTSKVREVLDARRE